MTDWHIRVLRATARRSNRRLSDDRPREGEAAPESAERRSELKRRFARAQTALKDAEARRRSQ